MVRTQLSTNVSPDIRRKVDELMERGYSLRDIVSRGVDWMYRQEIGRAECRRLRGNENDQRS